MRNGTQLILTHNSYKNLGRIIKGAQGGAFSQHSGLFYLVSHSSDGGLLIWDWHSGRFMRTPINYSPGFPNYQELEGVTVWNLDSGRAPGIRGQVHVVMIENNVASADDVWVKHFDVDRERIVPHPHPR